MAENVVEILVKSINDTRKGFDAAKADAENAGDSAGYSFGYAFQRRISSMMMSLAGAGGGGAGGGEATFFETFGSQFGMLAAGALVAAPAVAAVVTEVVALASGFAAMSAGAGAFLLFAKPTFTQLQQDATQLLTLWNNLQTAQDKLAVTQQNFAADPTKANAAAVASAQKGLATAQTNLQAAQMGMGQDAGGAATAVLQLRTEYDKLSASLQPQVFQILADGLQAVTKFLPALAPMAQAFAGALGPLLQQLGQFAQSKGFHDWLQQFDQIIGPATTAIGEGVGKLVGSIGKLFTIMSSHDVVHAINILFDFLSGFFNGLATWIKGAMNNWDRFSGAMKEAWANVKRWTDDAVKWLEGALDNIVTFFKKLPGLVAQALSGFAGIMFSIGKDAMGGLLHGLESVPVVGGIVGIVGDLIGHAKSAAGVKSPSTVFREIGQNITEGLRLGLQDNAANLHVGGSIGITGGAGATLGGGVQVVFSGAGATEFQHLVRMLWPGLMLEVRTRGGGGKNSAQIALGQTH